LHSVKHGKQQSRNGAILVATGSWAPEPWAETVRELDPGRPVCIWPDLPDPAAIRYLLAWQPPDEALGALPGLEVIFSLGAGVEHIVLRNNLPDVPIVRIVSPDLTRRMTEWVVLQVLLHHRQQLAYLAQQRERRWQGRPQPVASDIRVGIMGLGVLGRAATAPLVGLGFQVAGWSRGRRTIPGVEGYAGAAELDAFLARTDILVCLLPLTPDTRHILSMPLFEKLARDGAATGPVVINAGRGGQLVEADLIEAIRRGVLKGASLDVFETEPLDASSPLWGLDNVVITPHCAAWSDPRQLTRLILDQIAAHEAGRPLQNVVDRQAKY